MKKFLLINSSLLLKFWAKTIDTVYYLYNCSLIKSRKKVLMQKKSWAKIKQNVSYIQVFGSIVSVFIPI